MILFLKNALFTIVVPGIAGVLVPYWIASAGRGAPMSWGIRQYGALLLWLIGAAIYLRCVWDFAVVGRGTPLPIDAPKVLVIRGFYRYVRNPIYLSALLVLLAWVLYSSSPALLVYTVAAALGFHLLVILYEEPTLRRQFGESYARYCRAVNRWVPSPRYVP